MVTDKPVTEDMLHLELGKCREATKGEIKVWLDSHERMEFEKHDHIDKSLQELTRSVHELTDVFSQGKGALTLIKWLAVITAAAWSLMIWARDHLKI